jgi:hypothetical protein
MGLIGGIWLALLGVLAVPSLILARKPDAKELLGKIAPYQGWIGAASAIWGVWGLVQSVLNLGWLSHWPVYWGSYFAASFLQFALGLLLGVGVLKQFVKQAQAVEKIDMLVARLAPKQGALGVAAIAVGAWLVAAGFLFRIT